MKRSEIKSLLLVGIPSKTSNRYGRNMPYLRFRVFLNMPGRGIEDISYAFPDEELKKLSYWSPRSKTMSMTCWGTSQLFEAQISLGHWIGWDSKDWPEFSRKVTNAFVCP